jgi:acetylglutamate kinase
MSGVLVYKVGGPALEDASLLPPLAEEVRSAAGRVALVDRLLRALSIESRFVDGRRETSPRAMEVVEMVLSGAVNKALAAGLTEAGVDAIGLSGRDSGLIRARLEPGLGLVGTPAEVRTEVLVSVWSAGFVPVISPVSSGPGGEAVNVNADEAALGLARALGARALVYLSDVDGVHIGGEAVERLSDEDAERYIDDGSISGGMALKVRVALEASRSGITEVVIAGRARLTGGFRGTMVTAAVREASR